MPDADPSSHPLATVNDSYNAVFVHGDAVEDAMFFGRGAGELPTASAVVGDVFDIVRNILAGCCGRIGCTCYKNIPVKKMEDTHNRYFLRLKVEDRCGVLAEMTAIFAKYQVSVAQIIQKDTKVEGCAEVVVITEKVREGDFRTAIEKLRNRDSVRKDFNDHSCIWKISYCSFHIYSNENETDTKKELKNPEILILYKRCQI